MSTQNNNTNEAKSSIIIHIKASLEYLENGQLMLNKGEPGKAGEMLWGSVAQALEALAESRNIKLSNHRSLRWFVTEISRETNNKNISNAFYQAEALHSNFHSVNMTVNDIAVNLESIKNLVSILFSLIPKELTKQ
ncbi:MAG: PaREP1 family protein [Dehalococcoidales bacterium]|nr:PaREP1 family protein [Dehalococcoidales bacterium]